MQTKRDPFRGRCFVYVPVGIQLPAEGFNVDEQRAYSRKYWFLCVVALMLGVANPAVFAAETAAAATNGTENYSSLQAAVNDYTSGVIVMETNAQDLTVNRDVYLGLNGHTVENGKANEMTLIAADAEFTAHNQYKYTLDGEVILYMATFSDVLMVANETNAWGGKIDTTWYNTTDTSFEIRNADQLAGFGAIVGGMVKDSSGNVIEDTFNGKTVKLLADISIGDLVSDNDKVFYPIGYYNNTGSYEKVTSVAVSSSLKPFEGTFDGNGNTISDFYQNTWEMFGDYNDGYPAYSNHYRDGMGLFGKVYGGTVKNLTVTNFQCDSEHGTTGTIAVYADCGATFENISIFKCNPRVYNIGNGGIVGCIGWYANEASENPVTLKNITVDKSNKISALWGTYDAACGGLVGQYYPTSGQDSAIQNKGITMVNCHVSAEMDVNNDVCGNYQYYWYRYCGMLIGSVRNNTTENGYTVADLTGIEVVDCTYTMGDWNEYWYCELVKNSLASYTHDHQFSRLTKIEDLSRFWNGEKWLEEGNFVIVDGNPNDGTAKATCYHIFKNSEGNLYQHKHEEGDETNGNDPYETVNGEKQLKEDNSCIYLPFNQVLSGLGYGVKPTYELSGFDPVDGIVKSYNKFEAKADMPTTFYTGQTVTLGELFNSLANDTVLSVTSTYAAVSPADDNSTASAVYKLDKTNWENSTITFTDDCEGLAKIVITDYFYCQPTVVYVTVKDAGEKEEVEVKDTDIVVPFLFSTNAG